MNSLVMIQQRQTPWARRALGLFVVAWLNLALLPCAMALDDMQERGCPHAPPAVPGETTLPGADESSDMLPEDASCCDVETSQCALQDDYNYDGRTVQCKLKDAPLGLPVAIVPAFLAIPVADNVPASLDFDDASRRPGVQPPINVLNCVYLI